MKISTDELKLWESLREGNQQAFGKLYDLFVQPLYSYSLNITSDKDLIKDCIHDLFVELWKNHQNLGPTTSVKFYLMASIKRKLIRNIDYNMKKNSKNYNYAIYENDSFKNIEVTMIEMETSKLNKHLMDTCLLKLSKRQRQAIHLKYFNNLDTVQISNTMKINQQSVYNLIFGALKSLKTTLGTEFECQY